MMNNDNNDSNSNNNFSDNSQYTKIGEGIPFQRLRRITGYLVGDISRWNNGKLAELKDRSKHEVNQETQSIISK